MVRGTERIVSCAAAAMLVGAGSVALADGGLVRASASSGAFLITVFTSPTPIRVGPVDASVMVQDLETRRPVLDAQVALEWEAVSDRRSLRVEATREQATNKLLYAALPALPRAGEWNLHVQVSRAGERGELSCRLEVLPARTPLMSYWFYLALPPLGVVLFALNRLARGRRRCEDDSRSRQLDIVSRELE